MNLPLRLGSATKNRSLMGAGFTKENEMTELTKIETSRLSRGWSERIVMATIIVLLIAVQIAYVAKRSVTFATIAAPAAFGIIAP